MTPSHWRLLLLLALAAISWLALSERPPRALSSGWDKSNHLLAFVALGWLALRAQARPRWARVWAGLLLYGVLLEGAQGLTPTRQAEAWDVAADALGIALAQLLHSGWVRWQQLR